MKIRSDFVTNSSSSSFIVVDINSKKIAEIFKRFYEGILNSDDRYIAQSLDIDEDNVNLQMESYVEVPESAENLIESLITAIDYWHLIDWKYENGEIEYFVNEDNLPEEYKNDPKTHLIRELWERRKELNEDIKECRFEFTEHSWGGDLDGAWDADNYDEEYKAEVAEALGYESVGDMPDDRFIEFVDPEECVETESFVYVKGEGGEYKRTYRPER